MLPHVKDRPLTMKRYPDGVDGQSFFEKHVPRHAPDWLRHVSVPTSDSGTTVDYSVICDLPDLVWAANLATIEFHVPLWRIGRRRKLPAPPDHMVFDLDPGEGATIVECCQVARAIADLLETRNLESYAKTSGSKGLQLYVPVGNRSTWERVRRDAHQIATALERDRPDLVVSNMRKSLRGNKVLIDWSQNHPAKTTVAAYSLRARPDPTVSTPVTWEEVGRCADRGRRRPAPLHRGRRPRSSGRARRPLRTARPGGLTCRTTARPDLGPSGRPFPVGQANRVRRPSAPQAADSQ